MTLALHGVLLGYLALALVWNAVAACAGPAAEGAAAAGADGPPPPSRRLERVVLLPLVALLAALVVRDVLAVHSTRWLAHPLLAALLPLGFALALVQNAVAIRRRGARLSDIPLVLFNAGVGACVAVAAYVAGGGVVSGGAEVLLYDYSVLQRLLGSFLAHVAGTCWHVPLLLRGAPVTSWPGLIGGLLPAGVAAYAVAILVAFRPGAAEVVESFDREPRLAALRAGLETGVWDLPDAAHAVTVRPPGSLAAWRLPVDLDASGLVPPDRPLVLELTAPAGWRLGVPPPAEVEEIVLAGAERLAHRLAPALLLPAGEPDGEATLVFGARTPAEWRDFYRRVGERVAAASPDTIVAVRLAGVGERSRALLDALLAEPAVVGAAGPRLAPAGIGDGGAAAADAVLASWESWLAARAEPPALWVLAAGCSPLAYGPTSQARFVEGCLARASRTPRVAGVLIDGWTSRGHALGVMHRSDPRPAALVLDRLLPGP